MTTIRDLGNFPEIFRLRNAVDRRDVLGPRILGAGELLEGPHAEWPFGRTFTNRRAAVAEVRRQVRMAADWIKLYFHVPPNLAKTVIQEAHRHGVKVAGHLSATTARQASAMGIDSLEHAIFLVDDGFLNAEWRARIPQGTDMPSVRRRRTMMWLNADFESLAARQLIGRLRRRGIVVCATMVLYENYFLGLHRDLERAIEEMPARWRQTWDGWFRSWHSGAEPDPQVEDVYRRMASFVRNLHRAGVRMLPGTDASAHRAFGVPGLTLHREFAILESLGFRRAELLALATAEAANALGRAHDFGSIAPGRAADLLILRNDPLDDLKNLRNPEIVVVRGRQFSGEELRA